MDIVYILFGLYFYFSCGLVGLMKSFVKGAAYALGLYTWWYSGGRIARLFAFCTA